LAKPIQREAPISGQLCRLIQPVNSTGMTKKTMTSAMAGAM